MGIDLGGAGCSAESVIFLNFFKKNIFFSENQNIFSHIDFMIFRYVFHF